QTLAVLHTFTPTNGIAGTNGDGAYPIAGPVLAGDTLFGTAIFGGISGNGTIYKVKTDGTGFTIIHSFSSASGTFPLITNDDGALPRAAVTFSGERLYGTARYGGKFGYGTVFAMNTDGSGFTNLHYFTGQSDGSNPRSGLFLSGDTLYGTSTLGG